MPGERCAEHRPRQESLARVGARSGRGTAGGRLARAANDLFALLQDTAIIAGRPGNGSAGTAHPARGAGTDGPAQRS